MKLPRNAGAFSITTFDYLFSVVLLCYPALLFLIQGGMNGSLFLLAAFSLFLLATHRNKSNYFDKEQIIFAIAMSSGLGAIFISQLYHQDMTARYFDSAARFFLAIPILLASGFIKERVLFIVQYAFPLGALAAFVAILLPHPSFKFFTELVTTMMSSDARYSASTSYMNHIHLGDLALMLGCLSLFSVNWIQPDHLGVKLLKITGMIAGLAVSILSGAQFLWGYLLFFVRGASSSTRLQ
jgi:O-antigen ligase